MEQEQKSAQKKSSSLAVIVTVLIVLALAGAGIYFFFGPGKKAPGEPEKEITKPGEDHEQAGEGESGIFAHYSEKTIQRSSTKWPADDLPLEVPEMIYGEIVDNYEDSDKVWTILFLKNSDDALELYRKDLEKNGWVPDPDGKQGGDLLTYTRDGYKIIVFVDQYARESTIYIMKKE